MPTKTRKPFRGSLSCTTWESSRGEADRAAKLTDAKALEIWGLRGTATAAEVGRRYGVSANTVKDIWRRRPWRHVTEAKR